MASLMLISLSLSVPAAEEKTKKQEAKPSTPNFSGEWVLNREKSDYGRIPLPTKLVRRIDHQEPKIKLVTISTGPQGDLTTEYNYTTDGVEGTTLVRGTKVRHAAKWDSQTLEIEINRSLPDGKSLKTVERWHLSEDGKIMMSVSKMNTVNGEMTITAVFDKQ